MLTVPLICSTTASAQQKSDSLHTVRITLMNRGQVQALYKDCKNDLHIQIENFEDYNRLTYAIEGGTLHSDKARPTVISICPRNYQVKLTVSYKDSTLLETNYSVKPVPKPKLYVQYQGRLLTGGALLNKSAINDYTLVLSSIGEYFYSECKEDAHWEVSYHVKFIQKEDILFEYISTDGKLKDVPKELLRKTDLISVVPVKCSRMNFKGEKLPYDLGSLAYDFDLH